MESFFQLFQIIGSDGVVACNDVVNHSGSVEKMSNDYRGIQVIIHGFIALLTHCFHIYAGSGGRSDLFQSVHGIQHSG